MPTILYSFSFDSTYFDRCIQEPVRTIPHVVFYQADALRVDFEV